MGQQPRQEIDTMAFKDFELLDLLVEPIYNAISMSIALHPDLAETWETDDSLVGVLTRAKAKIDAMGLSEEQQKRHNRFLERESAAKKNHDAATAEKTQIFTAALDALDKSEEFEGPILATLRQSALKQRDSEIAALDAALDAVQTECRVGISAIRNENKGEVLESVKVGIAQRKRPQPKEPFFGNVWRIDDSGLTTVYLFHAHSEHDYHVTDEAGLVVNMGDGVPFVGKDLGVGVKSKTRAKQIVFYGITEGAKRVKEIERRGNWGLSELSRSGVRGVSQDASGVTWVFAEDKAAAEDKDKDKDKDN
jgi:hypothetical protein